jgi:cytochrome c-type biogenesis protein CcmH/NrfF
MKPARFAVAVVAALVLGLAAPAAMAADCAPRTTLGDVEDEVMCPVCGTPLALATEAPQANRQRAFIQGLVDDCLTKDQVKDQLVAEYGSEVLATPEDSGFDLAATLVPVLAVLLGLGAVTGAAWQWRRTRRDQPGEPAADGPDADGSKRLQDDLDRYGL